MNVDTDKRVELLPLLKMKYFNKTPHLIEYNIVRILWLTVSRSIMIIVIILRPTNRYTNVKL